MPNRPAERGPSGTGHDTRGEELRKRRLPLFREVAALCREQGITISQALSEFQEVALTPDPPVAVPGPADPVVSPADTPAVLRAYAEQLPTVLSVPNLRAKLREAADEIDALLAVGERDRRQIARLMEGLREYVSPQHWQDIAAVLAGEEDAG